MKSASHSNECKSSIQEAACSCNWPLHKPWPSFSEQKIKELIELLL